MKKGFNYFIVLLGCIFISCSMASAMNDMTMGGCCSAGSTSMTCSSMGNCNHDACTCHFALTDENEQSGKECTCCAMCVDQGCGKDMLPAVVSINPGNLSVKSQGEFITVYIELNVPDNPLAVYNIDAASIYLKKADDIKIRIDGKKLLTVGFLEYGDYDENDIIDLMVKFDRQDLIAFLTTHAFDNGEVSISVSGKLYDGTGFKGSQTITVRGN